MFSYREGFGNVALEAAAMSKPVIVSDIPGAKDTVEHMSSGMHVASKNVEELTKALQFYIDNSEIRIKHGEYGAVRAREYFSSEVIWNGQYELYKNLISE
ncbi:Glycosyl transferase group 1 [Flavobacterium beibuense]|uniref:Glycosyl transferase group 1 n=1 Tax=Flavobacterium beibuense TaxID=657326 RepID=A0A444WIP2_9FLAO|nr:Glycosyl transferase group 1 [Flavobacterium beibuense]